MPERSMRSSVSSALTVCCCESRFGGSVKLVNGAEKPKTSEDSSCNHEFAVVVFSQRQLGGTYATALLAGDV